MARIFQPGAPARPGPAPAGPMQRHRQVRLRLMLVALSVSLWSLVIVGRLVVLQVLEHASYVRQAARQSERTIVLDPRRGPIVDRSGHELAVSVDAESVYAVPQEIRDPTGTAAALAGPLGLDAAARKELLAQLLKARAFAWVRRKLDPQTVASVRALQLDGIGFVTETRRYYPHRELAAHVLGTVGLDNKGMSGVEYAFEDDIRGRAAKVVVRTDARRRPVGHTEKPSTEGARVVLTIDEPIQHAAERELARAVEETGAVAGMAIVMDPKTGEILALANEPTFNPNVRLPPNQSRWRNRAVADAFEPGSIFKMFTAAAALQEKAVAPDDVLDCGGGSIDIAGTRINDHAVFYNLTFRDVIAKSSDIGVIRVAQRLGRDTFNRYVHDFGFGAPTGVELPGESGGLLRPPSHWSALSLASMSFGQEIGVTELQMAAAVSAIANGGYLMKPIVVSRVEDATGRVMQSFKPMPVRRVLEPETIATLTSVLESVVQTGTGRKAAIPGYVVAGKTGTAQKVEPSGRYSMIDHVASFAGYVPADDPAIVVVVSLDTPRGPRNQGGDVAAPLFARIAEPALRRLAVPSSDAARVLRASLVPPAPLAAPAPPPATAAEAAVMPDLRGLSAREAALEAVRRGLIVALSGSGSVVDQEPLPGAPLESGMACRLTLRLRSETVADAAMAAGGAR